MPRHRVLILATMLLVMGCARRYPALANRTLYTCCNLHFNRDGDASDANYENIGGTIVALGTRVTVVNDHRNVIDFRAAIPSQQVFTLVFRFGRSHMKAAEYFSLIL